ncbi:hypothetical protein AB0J72_29585 [Dactylosporangium sp. NPDC049742]|uniref:hypothetical protein n=1 Tax=Dactylosporangium sp. NPDC049742 TaxID=3154737 RepID=UPI0034482526
MTDEQVTDLLERAVAEVPPALLQAPHAGIRRRIRRRRMTRAGAVVAAALAVLAGFAAAPTGGAPYVPTGGPSASTGRAWVPQVPWDVAQIDRTGTRITVYAAPLPGKCVERDPADDRVEWADNRITLHLAGSYTGCGDDSQPASRTFELPQAVGGRGIVDGREPLEPRVLVRAADLPDLAAGGWTELPAVRLHGVLAWRFTRPGGPDLALRAYRLSAGVVLSEPDHTLRLGSRTAAVYDRPGDRSAGWWSDDHQVWYTITAVDPAIGKSGFDAVLRGMTWT